MDRPYIICHMLTSIDGKVTGDFLRSSSSESATEIYYEINRRYKADGSGGFICGRVTMEDSFTNGYYPDLSDYQPIERECGHYKDYWSDYQTGYYAIAFDPKGRLGWRSAFIDDYDPGYDKAQIIEILTEQVDGRYLAYLQEKGISYLIAGDTEINVKFALKAIYDHLTPKFYLLEGGSIINSHFLRYDCIDELSLVQAPITSDYDSKPLFSTVTSENFTVTGCIQQNGALVLNYKKTENK